MCACVRARNEYIQIDYGANLILASMLYNYKFGLLFKCNSGLMVGRNFSALFANRCFICVAVCERVSFQSETN